MRLNKLGKIFMSSYISELAQRFATDPLYSDGATYTTPEALANKMLIAICAGDAELHTPAIEATLAKCGIPNDKRKIRRLLIYSK
jgi:hypothetical protein